MVVVSSLAADRVDTLSGSFVFFGKRGSRGMPPLFTAEGAADLLIENWMTLCYAPSSPWQETSVSNFSSFSGSFGSKTELKQGNRNLPKNRDILLYL